MTKKRGMALVLGLMLVSQPVWAARTAVHDAAESSEYGRKAGGMFGRGLINIATCFVDLLVDTVNETKSGPPLVGTLVGIGKGAGCTTLRALSGVVDVVTFWVPNFNGIPVSESYDNCIPAESSDDVELTPSSTSMRAPDMMPSGMMPPAASSAPMAASAPVHKEEKPKYTK